MSATLDPRRREAARLAELDRLEAMRPEADRVLQELVDDAREVFGTEFCLVNLVTSDTQYFRAWSGDLPSELAEVKRNPGGPSMCRYVVEDERPFVVEDFSTTEQAKVRRLRMGPGVRFYAGTPLKTSGGHAIGSFCVLDGRPREFGDRDSATLRAFAKAVVGRLEALGAAAHEREAKESERRYRRNVFELANDAILIYGAETGLILDANRRACEMYGIPQETLVGKKIFELSSEPKEEYSQELLDRGSHLGFETVHRRADGTHIHVSINSSVTEYGGQRAILSINRDVTGRRQAEKKIRRSEARNNAILDASPDLMFLLDRAGEFLDYKAGGNEAQLYVPTEGIVGRKVGDLMPAEIAETALHLIARALDTGELQVHEYRLSMQAGPRDFEARLVKSGTNEVLCIVRDVTERKRTEAALRLSEKRLAQAQRITHTGNWEHELGKNRTHWSDEMYRIFGLTPLSLVPSYKTFMLFVHPDDRERVRGSIRGALHGDGPEDIEYRIVRPDGEVRFVNTQYEAAYDESGRPTKFFGTVQDVTDRKRVEQNLGEAEERYRTLLEQIPAVAYIDRADVADVPFYTSPRIEALLGYTPEEWLGGRLWLERLHPDDRDWVLEADTRARAAEEPFGEEYRLIDRDGRVVWVCDESVLLRDEAGRPLLWQGVLLDITERKRAEEALRRSEERFRSLIQNAPDVIMVLDADSTILYDSPSIQRVLGYDPGERIGSKGFDYVHPEDLGRAKRTFVEVLTNPVIEAPAEYRLRHKDGSWRDFEATRTNLLDDPAVGGVVINCRDVTEHKRFEEALRQSEARFRTIFERSAMGISIADPDRKLLETNRAYQDMLGYNREELLGKSIADISHPEDVPEDEELNGSLLAGDRDSYRTEKRYVRKDGGSIWARPTVSAVRDARGEPQFLIGMVEDITERKRWEERLREAEKKYRTLVERIPAVTYVQEATGSKTVTYVSPQIETVLGYAPEEYISDPDHWAKILHPEDKERVLAEGKRADETGEPYKTEYRQFARDGRVVWMRDEAALVRDEEDAPSYWLGVKTDITERREAEAALRESEERFQRLADAAFEGIIVHDGGEVLEANTAYAAMHGCEVSEIVGRSALEWAAPEYRTLVRQHILAGHEEPYESVEMKKDGTRIDVEVRGKAISYQGRTVRVAAVRDITERKRAEQALRESEERYRLVAKATNEVIWDNDLATGKQLWDGAVQTMFGYSPVELGEEGRWWEERIHPDDRRRVLPRLEALLGGDGELWTEEYRFRRQDGAYATVVDRAYVVRDVEGKPVRMLGSMMDITERKRTEEELEESRRRLSALLSNAPAYLYRCRNEPGWPNEFVSDYALELTGYTPEELTDGSVMFADLIVGADRGRVWDETQAALSARRGFELRYSLRRKDGEIRHVEERGRGLHGEGGVAAAIEGVVYDVTERVRTEERLGEAEKLYRTLVEQIPAVTYIDSVDDPDTSLYTSPQIEELLGYSPEEWQNDCLWSKRLHPEDRERVLAADERFESGGEPFREEYRLLARDGSVVWVREEAVLISNEAGEPLCWQGVIFDVTEQKEAEEALKQSEERYRNQSRELALLHQVRTALAHELEPPAVFRTVVETIAQTYGYTQVSAYRLQGETLELQHQVGYEQVLDRIPITRGIMGRVTRTGQPALLEDVRSDPEFLGAIEGITSEVCVPLLDEDGIMGILNIESTEGVALTEDDLHLMSALAEHMKVALGRARLLAQVRDSEERFRSLIQNASDIITLLEADGTVRYQSLSIARILGYQPEELIGKNVFEYIHPEDVERALSAFAEGVEKPEIRPFAEYRFLHKDGSWRHLESIGSNLLDDPGVGKFVVNSRDITERKRGEEKLRVAEERYRSLVETIPAITYVGELDEISSSIYISPQIESILGFTSEERMSTPDLWVERLHTEDRERVLAKNDRSNATGDPLDVEYRIVARDGHEVWMHDAAVVLRDPEGRPSYRQGVMFDVTERRQTEEALHASEARLRTVIEQSPLGIHIFAPDGTSLLANGAWDRLWCLDDEESGHANIFEDEQLRNAGLIEHIERSVAEGAAIIAAPLLFDPAEVGREGSPCWLRSLIYPVRGEDGRVFEIVLLLEDVTERARAGEALKESEKRYKAVVEQSAEAIWLFDPDTKRVLEANAAFQEMLGYDAEELRGMTNYDFVDHSREDVDRAVARKLRGEKTLREERKYRMKDGTLLDVEVGGTVISYHGKSVVCSVARDITERKLVEEEMREANRRLSELAILRADFTAMVAHELDTPLAVIRGYADVIATGELGPAERERALSRIQAETEVLNALVGDVRVAASAERKDFTVNPRRVPVGGLLEDAARFVATLSNDHPLVLEGAVDVAPWDGVRAGYADQFVFEDGADRQKVWADRYRIGQVLRNLLTNAVKYSPGGTSIELRAVPDEAAGRVRIEVIDHGPGIHPDDMERIFEKFGRGRDPEGRKVAGLGLGLYISRRILRAHGSDLTVKAAPGGGSVFSFDLKSDR